MTQERWRVWIGEDGSVNVSAENGRYIALVGVLSGAEADDEKIRADAELIAAAPDMQREIEFFQSKGEKWIASPPN